MRVTDLGGSADTAGAGGVVTAPGAGANVVQVASANLPAGIYRVRVWWLLTATAETALTNGRVRAGGSNVVNTLPTISAAGPMEVTVDRVKLDGTQALTFQAIAAAVAGSVYSAWIMATKLD